MAEARRTGTSQSGDTDSTRDMQPVERRGRADTYPGVTVPPFCPILSSTRALLAETNAFSDSRRFREPIRKLRLGAIRY